MRLLGLSERGGQGIGWRGKGCGFGKLYFAVKGSPSHAWGFWWVPQRMEPLEGVELGHAIASAFYRERGVAQGRGLGASRHLDEGACDWEHTQHSPKSQCAAHNLFLEALLPAGL